MHLVACGAMLVLAATSWASCSGDTPPSATRKTLDDSGPAPVHIRPAPFVGEEARALLKAGEYDRLNALALHYERTHALTFDHRSALEAFYEGLSNGFDNSARCGRTEADLLSERQAIREWLAATPDSVPAKLAMARFMIKYAWHGRTGGYASTVTDQQWATFRSRMSEAASMLASLEPVAGKNPAWLAAMLQLALAQGRPAHEFESLYRRAVAADRYFVSIYVMSAEYYAEKWYGTKALMREAIDRAVASTRPGLGLAMYARLHRDRSTSPDMFTNGDVDWKKMKAGFDDWLRLYPRDYTRNTYAYYSCIAEDVATLKEQLAILGDQLDVAAWNSKEYITYCKALARKEGTGQKPFCYSLEGSTEVICE